MRTRPSTQPRVVIVDDNVDTQEYCSLALHANGMDPVAFSEPVEAIDYLARGVRVDVVLTDLALPQMSGLDLAREIAKARPELPVVLMTGFPDRLEEAIALGALPLVKPFSTPQLVAVISEALSRGSSRSS